MLVWLLYVYEGHTKQVTFRRQRAVLGNEDRMYRSEVVERLEDMGVAGRYASDTVNAALATDASALDETPDGDDTWRQYQEGSS
jgi:predicted xylose isomerase-like sugar epimerase